MNVRDGVQSDHCLAKRITPNQLQQNTGDGDDPPVITIWGRPSMVLTDQNRSSLINGDDRSLINGDDWSLIDGDDQSLINGDDRSLIDGDDQSLIDGDDRSLIDGDDRSLIDGDDQSLINGDDRSLIDGVDLSVLTGHHHFGSAIDGVDWSEPVLNGMTNNWSLHEYPAVLHEDYSNIPVRRTPFASLLQLTSGPDRRTSDEYLAVLQKTIAHANRFD
ncbi:hypothetical protein PGTUg99_026462 [Puccinia graminis f. sp. tritici]|uniref:Uncharacterized protein n=1 Tax=Puccinia graminis f. sp. tritici TaxID=56615 RepID=A0A5B0Q4N7_PUCGR|nr:hypothetical protein PGTUg99_026462 [Puccinia graminis f. sp. tritici]